MIAVAATFVLALGAPAQAQGIDVVIKIDESGSMGDDIAAVKANVVTIFNALPPGSSVGLVGYGARASTDHNPTAGLPHVHTPLTSDSTTFGNAVDELIASGGFEPGYRVVYESANDNVYDETLSFTGAPYCNILITDESLDQDTITQQQAIDAMNNVGGIFFGIIPSGVFTEAQLLADETGGQLFNLTSFRTDPTPVIEAVLAACVEAAIPIKVDVKPESCPNPFRLTQKGTIPVALLGSETFDVSRIRPETVMLESDCPALRWDIEDVATPYDGGFSEPLDENECTENGADGYADLTLKFDSKCVASQQGVVTENDVRLWKITGIYVNDSFEEVPFEVEDVVRVMP